jgi:hypothetical protein
LINPSAPKFACKINERHVNNSEIYKAGEFRVQRQARAPQSAPNNNEYQAVNKGRDHRQKHAPCARGANPDRAAAHRTKQKPGAVSRPGTPTQFQFRG